MNEADQNFLPDDVERLTRATAPPDATATDLDAETLALRDGFLRLGELLDQAAEFDEAALLAKLNHSLQSEAPAPARREKQKQRPWILPASIVGGVVAAAIILLLCQTFFTFDFDPDIKPIANLPGTKTIPEVDSNLDMTGFAPWRDVLDERLTMAQIRMQEASHLPLRRTSLISAAEEMRAMQHELNTSSL